MHMLTFQVVLIVVDGLLVQEILYSSPGVRACLVVISTTSVLTHITAVGE